MLEGNLVLNKPIAFNQTIMTTGGNFHFTVNPMLIIVHIALFIECSRTTARELHLGGKFIPEPSVTINRAPPPYNLSVPYSLQVSRLNSPISSTYPPNDIKLLLSITIK